MNPHSQAMLDQVAQALDTKDYRTATHLLKTLWQEMPENPWVQIYRARLYEAADKGDQAETIYRHLLKDVTNAKIALQARQGLQRLQDSDKAQRQSALAAAQANTPDGDAPGLLILEAIPPNDRQIAAQHMAKVMQLDPYSARMQIPNRGWKLYRTGNLGELQFYGEQIRSGNIPVFWVATENIKSVPVFQVKSIQEFEPAASIICENPAGQLGELSFKWSEVTQRVDGALPIFENVIDTDILREGTRRMKKEETRDYVRVTDLHLPQRECILRFSDRTYDFHAGLVFTAEGKLDAINTRVQWNSLIDFLQRQRPDIPVWNDFSPFAEGVMDYPGLLEQIKPQIHFYEQGNNLWPSAFQLYSSLAFWRGN
jgi:Tetratricopeptide repeat